MAGNRLPADEAVPPGQTPSRHRDSLSGLLKRALTGNRCERIILLLSRASGPSGEKPMPLDPVPGQTCVDRVGGQGGVRVRPMPRTVLSIG